MACLAIAEDEMSWHYFEPEVCLYEPREKSYG
jgi:hypothetical protein